MALTSSAAPIVSGEAGTGVGGSAMSYREGIYEAMALLNGEWVVAVLASLATRPLKYMELREEINLAEERRGWSSHARPVSQKVLSATLRRMRRDGLVTRSEEKASFNPVWYELTPLGQTLLMSLRPVAKWAQGNRAEVEAARARYEDEELAERS
ncbi:winged helix-turn-helix transcriptional regulator [Actinophytocola oryzae]|uniref:HxlR family transcriptional regulator n=1 Tax=Actinophytocola oryzae TaxID=502181 RepID=A0A4R7V864_9PSEU|nr:helix-turn-helix domain-containing protein [Actinophytocola oryzae]TDV44176.1 HxlR family transcriptional regulator [Actinophytocola oryzae]